MKKFLLVFIVLLAFSGSLCAQDKMKPVFYAGGGMSMPMGPTAFKDFWKMGPSFGGGIGIQISPRMELIGKIYYTTNSFNEDKIASGVTLEGGKLKFLAFGVDGKFMFPGSKGVGFIPYFIAGLGMTKAELEETTISGDDEVMPFAAISETKLALNIGAGFDYMFSPKAGLWLDGRLDMVMTEGDSFTMFPLRAGLKFILGNDKK